MIQMARQAVLLLPLLVFVPACSGGVADALRSGCLAGCGRAPRSHTSLAQDPGADPGPGSGSLSMVWLHHSTGDRLLQGGLRRALQDNGVAFYDINYGEAAVGGYVIGDHTDPPDFPTIFNTAAYLDVIRRWELKGAQGQHDVIMFKSCYPASNISSDGLLQQYKELYLSLLPTFRRHPRILFIPMSTPPLVRAHTTPANAARARRWAGWLSRSYAGGASNVRVFDLFSALAIAVGSADANTLVPQFAEGPGDSHPNMVGAQAVTRLFIPWFNRVARPALASRPQ